MYYSQLVASKFPLVVKIGHAHAGSGKVRYNSITLLCANESWNTILVFFRTAQMLVCGLWNRLPLFTHSVIIIIYYTLSLTYCEIYNLSIFLAVSFSDKSSKITFSIFHFLQMSALFPCLHCTDICVRRYRGYPFLRQSVISIVIRFHWCLWLWDYVLTWCAS